MCSEVWQEKLRLVVVSDQTKLSILAVLNVSISVKKWLLTGCLLKVVTNCAILSNQKFWCGTLFPHKNKMKQRILQACNLKHSIRKGMFCIVGKVNLFGLDRENRLPLLSPWLYACVYAYSWNFLKTTTFKLPLVLFFYKGFTALIILYSEILIL